MQMPSNFESIPSFERQRVLLLLLLLLLVLLLLVVVVVLLLLLLKEVLLMLLLLQMLVVTGFSTGNNTTRPSEPGESREYAQTPSHDASALARTSAPIYVPIIVHVTAATSSTTASSPWCEERHQHVLRAGVLAGHGRLP